MRPNSAPPVEVQIEIPADANPGKHRVVIEAHAPSGNDTLPLVLDVAKQGPGAFALTSEFPRLQGTSEDTFTFSVDLENNTGEKATFNFTAEGPTGWSVDASPQLKQKASAVSVDAGDSVTVEVSADPPNNVPAGKYQIQLRARGAGRTLHTTFVARVTGSPDLAFQTVSERLNASGSPGETSDVKLVVRNKGTAPLESVDLSASPPSNWDVTFEPKTIPVIKPGKAVQVTAHVTTSGDAITGDYMVTLTASSESGSESVDIRYTVETSSWWGLIGILVIAAAVIGLLWAFRRFGRR